MSCGFSFVLSNAKSSPVKSSQVRHDQYLSACLLVLPEGEYGVEWIGLEGRVGTNVPP
jgi:hypothetical protein